MKKITSIALILVLALLLPCFAACGEGDGANTTAGVTTPATPDGDTTPAETTAAADAQVTNADGSCRHAKMNEWTVTGNYTCTGLSISTRSCKHCDFIQYEYTEDASGNMGDHVFEGEALASFPGSANTAAFEVKFCSFCQENVTVESASTATRKNHFLISADMLEAAGCEDVKSYINAGHSNVKYKSASGWGRKGFTAIHGMAALLNGERDASATDASGTILYWNIKDVDTKYTPDGVEDATAKYCSLIGYEIANPITVSGFSIFVNPVPEMTFDLLGGKTNEDGTITWTVLGGVDDVSKYITYNEDTGCYYADFPEITVDCIQIGVISAMQSQIYISELEIYGN
ncbi:MAG: hypothetical protein IKJ80_01465 [Clostridia bacterium]|nr:hypothetical protein [Clostridia bacterium]